MQIAFASGNINKVNQIKLMLNDFEIKSPKDFGIDDFEVIEDGKSLEENAYKKAKALFDLTMTPTISDDTGLFVKALDNRPGIYSHRYAGSKASYKDNRDKLLFELEGKALRDAYFETVICYIDENGDDHYFKGRLDGEITDREYGDYNFGYDMIYKPNGLDKTLGQMTDQQINEISHRSIAINKLKEFLKDNYDENSCN